MANFIATFSKLIDLADYPFWKICIKLNFASITYSSIVFTAEDMLNTSALSQTTNIDEVARRNFLGFQALAILNSILLDNLLMHGQPNTKTFWAYL